MRMWVSDISLYNDKAGGGYQYGTTITLKGTPMADTMIHECEHTCEYAWAYETMGSGMNNHKPPI